MVLRARSKPNTSTDYIWDKSLARYMNEFLRLSAFYFDNIVVVIDTSFLLF